MWSSPSQIANRRPLRIAAGRCESARLLQRIFPVVRKLDGSIKA
jgi:hypothetical protein